MLILTGQTPQTEWALGAKGGNAGKRADRYNIRTAFHSSLLLLRGLTSRVYALSKAMLKNGYGGLGRQGSAAEHWKEGGAKCRA